MTTRCQHDVRLPQEPEDLSMDKPTPLNKDVLGSHVLPEVCSGCNAGVVSSGPRWTVPTVENISGTTTATFIRWKKDKPWQGTPSILPLPAMRVVKPVTPEPTNRPTGQVILVPPTTRTIPYNTVTKWGELIPDIEWQARTPGRELARALDAKRTLTSLDKDFTTSRPSELSADGDDIAAFEPTESVTCSVPSSDDEHVEAVKLGRGPARSWKETIPQSHYVPTDLVILPHDFRNPTLGVSNRTDAFFLHAVLGMLLTFDSSSDDTVEGRWNQRFAEFVRRRATSYALPISERTFGAGTERKQVTMRLRNASEHDVRQAVDRLRSTGIYAAGRRTA